MTFFKNLYNTDNYALKAFSKNVIFVKIFSLFLYNMKFYLLFILLTLNVLAFAQDGLIKSYYPDGRLESQIFYIKDVMDGTAKWYYNNGVVKEEKNFSMGVLNGWIRSYYDNGAKKVEIPVNNGVKDGIAKEYYENGGLKKLFSYEHGVLKEQKEFKFDSTLKPPVLVYKRKDSDGTVKYYRLSDSTLISEDPQKEESVEQKIVQKSMKEKEPEKNKEKEVLPLPVVKNQRVDVNGVKYFMNVDIPPEPIGGYGLLQKKAVYPEAAEKAKIKGEVIIQAMINEYGKVIDAKVEKGLGYGCDEIAQKAVMSSLFRPGKIGKDYVNVLLNITLKFEEPD